MNFGLLVFAFGPSGFQIDFLGVSLVLNLHMEWTFLTTFVHNFLVVSENLTEVEIDARNDLLDRDCGLHFVVAFRKRPVIHLAQFHSGILGSTSSGTVERN